MGCWKDKPDRAISGGVRLTGSVDQCAKYAHTNGFNVFAVQYGGQCFTSPLAGITFKRHGVSAVCRDGKGGFWANNVYRISNSKYLV